MDKIDTNISTFKKSIESTIKAISKKSNINILSASDLNDAAKKIVNAIK